MWILKCSNTCRTVDTIDKERLCSTMKNPTCGFKSSNRGSIQKKGLREHNLARVVQVMAGLGTPGCPTLHPAQGRHPGLPDPRVREDITRGEKESTMPPYSQPLYLWQLSVSTISFIQLSPLWLCIHSIGFNATGIDSPFHFFFSPDSFLFKNPWRLLASPFDILNKTHCT